MTYRWQYQGKVEPLWTETATVDLDWYQEAEYPTAYLAEPPREPGYSVEPLWTLDTSIDFDWWQEAEYPAAYLVPPPRQQGWFEIPEWTITTAVDFDWYREPQYPAAYLIPPRPVDTGFQHEPLQALVYLAWTYRRGGWIVPAPGKPRRLAQHNIGGHR